MTLARKLSPEEARFLANLGRFGIESSDDVSPAMRIVGQNDALRALEMGLALDSPGFNVFISGSKGTGRFAAVRQMIEETVPSCPLTKSFVYAHNYKDHESPLLFTLGRGQAKELSQEIERLRNALRETIPSLLRSELLAKSRQRLAGKFERETRYIFGAFEERITGAGFSLIQSSTPDGSVQLADIQPIIGSEALPMDQVRAMPEDVGLTPADVERLEKQRRSFKEELAALVVRHRQVSTRYNRMMKDSETRKVREALAPLFATVHDRFTPIEPKIAGWLAAMREEVLEHLEYFHESGATSQPGSPSPQNFLESFLSTVQINLLFDPGLKADAEAGCAIIEENFPTYRNLIGTIEVGGEPPSATFLDIRAGSLLRANGGFLLLSARDVLSEPKVYDSLKRVLRRGLLEISPRDDGPGIQFGLKPEPIPVKVKVVLVGEPGTYDALYAGDPDFRKIFKVKVEFDDVMEHDDAHTRAFLTVVRRIIDREKLPSFSVQALESLLEEAVRVAGSRKFITTQFSDLADVMRESTHFAQKRSVARIEREDVDNALTGRSRRHGLTERRMLDHIRDGKFLLEVTGSRIGQINGLGYYDLDYAQFGIPLRISATASVGRNNLVNIERESDLSGSVHDKGMLILSGFLAETFAQNKPLALQAHIALEQSYVTIDGDSASLAELLCLLSALAKVPLRQDLAITGSINQRGGVQPIGGATEKIRGFFRSCEIRGLTGTQGVVIPTLNVDELHLDRDIVDALRAGKFHLYAVSNYTQALALFTGKDPDSVLAAADATLNAYASIAKAHGVDR